MKATLILRTLVLALLLLALPGGLASCARRAPAGLPQAWIDSPSDGAMVPLGSPMPVACRAAASKGVAELLLSVNGAPYRSVPAPDGATSFAATMDWLPDKAGYYTFQVTALDSTGVESSPATAIVRAEGPAVGEPADTPAAVVTATPTPQVPSADPTPTPTATGLPPTATPTQQPTATPSLTPFPPPQVSFTVDQATINQGQCTTLRWTVEHVTAVYLDGAGVVGNDTREVCPSDTTTYLLHVEAPGGNVDTSVTVSVVPDETAPAVPKPKLPEDHQSITPTTCPARVTLDWSSVSDPTGVAYQVRMEWKDGLTWKPVDASTWLEDSSLKVILQCDRIYRWSARAKDGAGNTSAWSPWFEFRLGST